MIYEMAKKWNKTPWEMEDEIMNLPVSQWEKWTEFERIKSGA
jgi:hypothetical protein